MEKTKLNLGLVELSDEEHVADLPHPSEDEPLQLEVVHLYELLDDGLRQVVRPVQVERSDLCTAAALHPPAIDESLSLSLTEAHLLVENIIVHAVQLASAEPGQGWDPSEQVTDDLTAQVSRRDVELLQGGRLVPLGEADLLPHQPGLLEQEAGQVFAALHQDLQTSPLHLNTRL